MSDRWKTMTKAGLALAALAGCGGAEPTGETASSEALATTQLISTNCQPVAITPDERMIFNTRQSNNLWDFRIGDKSCSGGQPILPAWDGHRGASSMTPDGRWLLIERAEGAGRASSAAEPGKGVGVQIQLLDRQTGRLTQLTTGRRGIIWSKLNSSGTKVVWAENLKWPLEAGSVFPWDPYFLGQWALHVADITATGQLAHEKSYSNTADPGFLETYGWVGNRLMFASDQGIATTGGWDWYQTQLWTIAEDLSSGPVRVSPPFVEPSWCSGQPWCQDWYVQLNPYHEFMHVAPAAMFPEGGTWILFGVVWEYDLTHSTTDKDPPYNGLDLWRMRLDGSGRQRVTQFNMTAYANVGGMAFDPADPHTIYLGVTGDANATNISAYKVKP